MRSGAESTGGSVKLKTITRDRTDECTKQTAGHTACRER